MPICSSRSCKILADSRLADAIQGRSLADAARLSYVPEKLEPIKVHLFLIVLVHLMLRQGKISQN